MKVSIVTISFNQGAFLERAIRSILEQDYPDLEYIVVDAGSSDGSREIIERYRPRIAKTILEPDGGPADGLNKGFAVATGDIFGYINADDLLLPGAVRNVVQEFERHPGCDMVYGNGYKADQNGRMLRRSLATDFDLRRYALQAVSYHQQSSFIRAQAFRDVGGFNVENRVCWDGELLVDMALAGKRFHRVSQYWSVFTIHSAGITGSGRFAQQYRNERFRLFSKIKGREYRSSDVALRGLAWIEKQIRHPWVPFIVMADKLIRSRRVFPL